MYTRRANRFKRGGVRANVAWTAVNGEEIPSRYIMAAARSELGAGLSWLCLSIFGAIALASSKTVPTTYDSVDREAGRPPCADEKFKTKTVRNVIGHRVKV